ncbi:family 1 glycosylhydrolase [Nocardia suismassiliense]|uniref:family 1 glycosylhydrolase n=1 Tax=Nocardia suismassiliense TaxID=2077092 RepID=UPI000D1D9E5B|nr:family 1 glycosylhydrolase [Nocardia suismassiliense]
MRTWTRRAAVALAASMAALLVPGMGVAQPEPTAGVAALGPDFLWGVAASGFQSEGHAPGNGGPGSVSAHRVSAGNDAPDSNWVRYIERHPEFDRYQSAIDFYNRYAADIDLAKSLGVKVFRIGIEWARLQPTSRLEWDADGFRFYDAVIAKIVKAGMRPMLTLDHWVYPGWAYDGAFRGKHSDSPDTGWDNPEMVEAWLANMRKVVDRYAPRNPLWVTINEPVAYIMHEVRNNATNQGRMEDLVAEAHNKIYDYIHQVRPDAQVTSNIGYVAGIDDQVNGALFAKIADHLDYIGVDYYFAYEPPASTPPATVRSIAAIGSPGMWNLPIRTEGIYYAVKRYAEEARKVGKPDMPIYVVENGMPTEDANSDDGNTPGTGNYNRSDHLRDTVYWLQRAKADGVNLIGYNYWSITDNYEWGSYRPRFGLYTVDVLSDPTLQRRPTKAVATYTETIAGGGVSPDYRPTRAPSGCDVVDPTPGCVDVAAP